MQKHAFRDVLSFQKKKKNSFIKKSVEQSKKPCKECLKLYHEKVCYESFSSLYKYGTR